MVERASAPPPLGTGLAALLCAALVFLGSGAPLAAEEAPADPPRIRNPYYETTAWKVWRDDPTPVEGVQSLVREGKEVKPVEVTLRVTPPGQRTWPQDPPAHRAETVPYTVFLPEVEPPAAYAGMWDDVYSSWSGLHGYVRSRWDGDDGSHVVVKGQIVDFVDVEHDKMLTAGVNFVHQSTTGMGHAITNGGIPQRTRSFERLYFADVLVAAPAHASFDDQRIDRTRDLYLAHWPTLFNAVGSSGSETMAITKLIAVGAYLPPATKLLLKRNGLYPAALLSIWKAALPYDVPYDHELRHRIAYKAVGDRVAYARHARYGAAKIERGDMALPFHQYDDTEHLRDMVDLARSMDVAPPEAVFGAIRIRAASEGSYSLRKAALVVQAAGQDVELLVPTGESYDLQDLPLTGRWKLLYGNKRTRVEPHPELPDTWVVRVPWDAGLPAGRTALAYVVNNGRFDSNPAILTVYRQQGDALPPTKVGKGEYAWRGKHDNRRPVLLGVQDRVVQPGETLDIALRAVDPEGYPVTIHKRAGEVGTLDGNRFTWHCPEDARGEHVVTFIASDGCAGNSYGGEAITVRVGDPAVLAQMTVDHLTGPAPLTVRASATPSVGKDLRFGWDVYVPKVKRARRPFGELTAGATLEHTFEQPGVYEIRLEARAAGVSDEETVRVLVTKAAPPASPAALQVEGNGVWIGRGDELPSAFDHTDFGRHVLGAAETHTFRLLNRGAEPLVLAGPVVVRGPGAGAFEVVRQPRREIDPHGSATFALSFAPTTAGAQRATVVVPGAPYDFAVRGIGAAK